MTPFIRSHGYDPRGVDGDRRHNRRIVSRVDAGYVQCVGREGSGCLTMIPKSAGRLVCQFCSRPTPIDYKRCLRCRKDKPVDMFASHGRYRVCDDCRHDAPMTPYERFQSAALSRAAYNRRHPRRTGRPMGRPRKVA